MLMLITAAWAQGIQEITPPAPKFSVFKILWGADPVVQLTLLILLAASVATWAVIFYKRRQIANTRLLGRRFIDAFWKVRNLEELLVKAPGGLSPMGSIFRSALKDIVGGRKNPVESAKASAPRVTAETIKKNIERATEDELEEMERYVPFLATTGSYAPFVGLFGTVWGILVAFWKIGSSGSSSLALVGPHIAEALIATAFGLATAIPAVIAYNVFTGRLRQVTREITTFAEDLETRIQTEFF